MKILIQQRPFNSYFNHSLNRINNRVEIDIYIFKCWFTFYPKWIKLHDSLIKPF